MVCCLIETIKSGSYIVVAYRKSKSSTWIYPLDVYIFVGPKSCEWFEFVWTERLVSDLRDVDIKVVMEPIFNSPTYNPVTFIRLRNVRIM